MRTSSRVKVSHFELRFQQLDCGYKARTLNAVLVKIIWMSTRETLIVSVFLCGGLSPLTLKLSRRLPHN